MAGGRGFGDRPSYGGTDRDLVRRILSSGDEGAKGCLYERYRREVERVIAGELKHARQVEVEDLSDEVWLTLFDPDKLAQWRGEDDSLRPWIRSIARNRACAYGRTIREVLWDFTDDSLDPPVAPDDPVEDPEGAALAGIAKARLMEAVYRCMADLTEVEYLAFSAWLEGDSLTDLAEELGKKPNAVYQDLDRAKTKVFGHLLRRYRYLLPEAYAEMTPRGKWGRA